MKANDRERLLVRVHWMLVLGCTVFITWLLSAKTQAQQQIPTPESVSTPVTVVLVTVKTGANLRAGPGTNYPRIGGAKAGQSIEIVARNPAGDWYQLANGAWIFGNLVENAPDVPVATDIPVPPAATPETGPAAPTVTAPNSAEQITVKVVANANLRAGPGTNYPKVGSARAGQSLAIVARNPTGDWYQTATGEWIFGELLESTAPLPIAPDIPTPPPAVTSTPAKVVTASAVESRPAVNRTQQAAGPSCSPEAPVVCVAQAKTAVVNWLNADLIRRNIFLAALSLWGAALMLLLARRRWRWVAHCVLVTILLLPIGWFVTLLTGLLVLLNPHDPTSPRELVQAMADSTVVQVFLLVAFLTLTAVSILGGIIVFGMLAIGYFVFLRLLPGPDYGSSPSYHVPSLPGSTASSSGYLSDGADYGSYSNDSYQGYYPDSRNDDDRDDDDGGGSIWDGWLVKW